MSYSFAGRMRRTLNSLLRPLGVQLVRTHSWEEPRTYIPFKETLAAAKLAGRSVSDYIDTTYNVAGASQEAIEQMQKLGVFDQRIDRVWGSFLVLAGTWRRQWRVASHPITKSTRLPMSGHNGSYADPVFCCD